MTKFKIAAILCSVSTVLFSQANPPKEIPEKMPLIIPHVEMPIKVDGVLDEPFWSQALVVPANIEVRPGENIESPVKTEAYLVYNSSHIYVGFKCQDPDPSQIRAHLCDRDQTWNDDWILILFDTFNDQQRTYDFSCNPFGIQADQIETTSGGGGSWDAIWESDGRITEDGYVVEMSIPFRSLGFPRSQDDQIWGFDVVRSYPRNVRHHIGSFPRDRSNNCYMCQSLKLIGFAGASPGKNVELAPTLSSVFTQEREDETSGPFFDKTKSTDLGLTMQWGFTPNLTLSGTLNPDFSNIEADAVQLDINSQFALYYSEKRPFFLEGADFFSTPFNLVHTRSLAEPDYGVKLSGKEGRNSIGFYTVQDRISNFIFPGAEGSDSESLNQKSQGSVIRYKRDVGESSNIGLVLTDRENDSYHNRVAGIDGNLKFSKTDQIIFQVTGSATQYPDSLASDYDQSHKEFDGKAFHLYYSHENRNWEVYQYARHVGDGFRADLGFITMSGFTYSETGFNIKWQRDPGSWFTWLNLYGSFDQRYDSDGNPLHRALTSRFSYQGPFQSDAGIYGEAGEDQYEGESFRANWFETWIFMRPSGWLAGQISTRYGDRIDYSNCRAGNQLNLYGYLQLRLGLHLQMEIKHTWDRLNVDAGRLYTANIESFKLIYQLNKRMFVRSIFQYWRYNRDVALYDDEDTESKEEGLVTQVMFSYKINPRTVFFLGYSDNYYGDHEIEFLQTNRTLFAKLGYAYNM